MIPRYDALQKALGERVRIRVLTYHYSIRHPPPEPVADVILTWNAESAAPEDRAVIYREAVRPICSPSYAEAHAEILNGPVADWSGLTLLGLTRPNEGWASWENWFEAHGRPDPAPRFVGYDSYLYVLESAAAGHGVAIGWRHFIERHVESGALIELGDGFIDTDNYYHGVLTEKWRRRPIARKCLDFFQQFM